MKINTERVEAYFRDIASMATPSWKEEPVIRYIESFAKKRRIRTRRFACGSSWNLLLSLDAVGGSGAEPLLFAAHTDTVVPCEGIKVLEDDKRFYTDGSTILGGDDKAAVASFLEAIDVILENRLPHGPLEFLFTCAEEVGLCGMKGMDFSGFAARRGFIFDSDGPVGSATVKAPYQISMRVDITGTPAHAGMEPEKGRSAIYAMASMIAGLPQGRIDAETTTNVGIVQGGKANNIVAEHAAFELEMRSLARAKVVALEKSVRKIIQSTARQRKVAVSIDSTMEYEGYHIRPTDPLIRHFERACASLGRKPAFKVSGGGSDTNILNARGVKALNLSVGMMKVHTGAEFLMKKDLHDGAAMVCALVAVS